jgi:nitrate reductase NapE component
MHDTSQQSGFGQRNHRNFAEARPYATSQTTESNTLKTPQIAGRVLIYVWAVVIALICIGARAPGTFLILVAGAAHIYFILPKTIALFHAKNLGSIRVVGAFGTIFWMLSIFGGSSTPEATTVGQSADIASNVTKQVPGVYLDVPSDPKAEYFVLEIKSLRQGLREITTRREGPSGTSFATRQVQCRPFKFRYVAEGDTYETLKRDDSFPFGPLVEGSISDVISRYACDNGTLETSSKAARPIETKSAQVEAARPVETKSAQVEATTIEGRNNPGKQQAYIDLTLNEIRKTLRDPEAAKFRNTAVFFGSGTPMVCGEVNARNGVGGYNGYEPFFASGVTIPLITRSSMIEGEFQPAWQKICQ